MVIAGLVWQNLTCTHSLGLCQVFKRASIQIPAYLSMINFLLFSCLPYKFQWPTSPQRPTSVSPAGENTKISLSEPPPAPTPGRKPVMFSDLCSLVFPMRDHGSMVQFPKSLIWHTFFSFLIYFRKRVLDNRSVPK